RAACARRSRGPWRAHPPRQRAMTRARAAKPTSTSRRRPTSTGNAGRARCSTAAWEPWNRIARARSQGPGSEAAVISKIIEYCAKNRLLVLMGVGFALLGAFYSIQRVKLDAIPDL